MGPTRRGYSALENGQGFNHSEVESNKCQRVEPLETQANTLWETLSSDLCKKIFSFIDPVMRAPLTEVCTRWRIAVIQLPFPKIAAYLSIIEILIRVAPQGSRTIESCSTPAAFACEKKETVTCSTIKATPHLATIAIRNKWKGLLKWAIQRNAVSDDLVYHAAGTGNLHALKRIYKKIYSQKHFTDYYSLWVAVAYGGNVKVAKWLFKLQEREYGSEERKGYSDVMYRAAAYGHFELLKYFKKTHPRFLTNICQTTELFEIAAGSGNLELLKWLKTFPMILTDNATKEAAGRGRLEVLKWLQEQGCP